MCRRVRGAWAINASRSEGLVGYECYVARGARRSWAGSGPAPRCGSVPCVVECGRLFMASKSGAGRGIHSSSSLPTHPVSPVRFRYARSQARCRKIRPRWVLSRLTYLSLPTNRHVVATRDPFPSVLADRWVTETEDHFPDNNHIICFYTSCNGAL